MYLNALFLIDIKLKLGVRYVYSDDFEISDYYQYSIITVINAASLWREYIFLSNLDSKN